MNKSTFTKTIFSFIMVALLVYTTVSIHSSNAAREAEYFEAHPRISKVTLFDQQVNDLEVNKNTLTIKELRENLNSVKPSSEVSAFGNYYVLEPYETEVLNSAISNIENRDFTVGFIMMDLATGYGVAYNVDEEFYSASTIKGIYVASITAAYPEIVETKSTQLFSAVDNSSDEDYFKLRIAHGHDPMISWCKEAGVDEAYGKEYFPYYSPRVLSKLWLRNHEYFSSNDETADEVWHFYESTLSSAIFNVLGPYYAVCTKGGWIGSDGYFCAMDAGIVYSESNPYLLVIMTDAPGEIAILEELVWELDAIHCDM